MSFRNSTSNQRDDELDEVPSEYEKRRARQRACLRHCQKTLRRDAPEDFRLLKNYLRAGIEGRAFMAARRKIKRKDLSIQVFRIKERIKRCCLDCIKQS